jgi:hypothetical protein
MKKAKTKRVVKNKARCKNKKDIHHLAVSSSAPKNFSMKSDGGEVELESWQITSLPKHGRPVTSITTWADDSEGSFVKIYFYDASQLRSFIDSLQSHCKWLENHGLKENSTVPAKKNKKTKDKHPGASRRAHDTKRIEENRNGLQPVYLGDKVWWDDDEEDFTGIYDVASIGEKPQDQHADTAVWLYSGERGKEVEVSLREIQNRINPMHLG